MQNQFQTNPGFRALFTQEQVLAPIGRKRQAVLGPQAGYGIQPQPPVPSSTTNKTLAEAHGETMGRRLSAMPQPQLKAAASFLDGVNTRLASAGQGSVRDHRAKAEALPVPFAADDFRKLEGHQDETLGSAPTASWSLGLDRGLRAAAPPAARRPAIDRVVGKAIATRSAVRQPTEAVKNRPRVPGRQVGLDHPTGPTAPAKVPGGGSASTYAHRERDAAQVSAMAQLLPVTQGVTVPLLAGVAAASVYQQKNMQGPAQASNFNPVGFTAPQQVTQTQHRERHKQQTNVALDALQLPSSSAAAAQPANAPKQRGRRGTSPPRR